MRWRAPIWATTILTLTAGINRHPCDRNRRGKSGVPTGIRTPVAAVKESAPVAVPGPDFALPRQHQSTAIVAEPSDALGVSECRWHRVHLLGELPFPVQGFSPSGRRSPDSAKLVERVNRRKTASAALLFGPPVRREIRAQLCDCHTHFTSPSVRPDQLLRIARKNVRHTVK